MSLWKVARVWAHWNHSLYMHFSYTVFFSILSSLGLTTGSGYNLMAVRSQVFFSFLWHTWLLIFLFLRENRKSNIHDPVFQVQQWSRLPRWIKHLFSLFFSSMKYLKATQTLSFHPPHSSVFYSQQCKNFWTMFLHNHNAISTINKVNANLWVLSENESYSKVPSCLKYVFIQFNGWVGILMRLVHSIRL